MCTLTAVAIGATLASGAMSAYGQYQQGRAQQEAANYRAAIQRNNAIRADQMAKDARERGEETAFQTRLKNRLVIGQMRVKMAGQGIDPGQDSAFEMLVDQGVQGEYDARTALNNAEREAQGYRIKAGQFRSGAALSRFSGRMAKRAGTMGAAGTLLGTAGKVAGKWYRFGGAQGPGGTDTGLASGYDNYDARRRARLNF